MVVITRILRTMARSFANSGAKTGVLMRSNEKGHVEGVDIQRRTRRSTDEVYRDQGKGVKAANRTSEWNVKRKVAKERT